MERERQHQEYLDRFRNCRSDINEIHHSNSGSNQTQMIRRRPSLLPHALGNTNEYNIMGSAAFLNRLERERYDFPGILIVINISNVLIVIES